MYNAITPAQIYALVIRTVIFAELAEAVRLSTDDYRAADKLIALAAATVKPIGRTEVYVRVSGYEGLSTAAVDRAFCALEGSPYSMPLEQGLITTCDASSVRFAW